LNLVKHIIEVATDVYTHKYVASYSYASTYSGGFNTNEYYKKLWSRYHNQYADDYEEEAQEAESDTNTASDYRNPPYLVYINEFADLDSFVDQLIWMNHLDYTPDELWPYIESDLATYEIDQETFDELAWDYYEYYNDCDYGRDDIYDGYAAL
jgi:hypothetical protein